KAAPEHFRFQASRTSNFGSELTFRIRSATKAWISSQNAAERLGFPVARKQTCMFLQSLSTQSIKLACFHGSYGIGIRGPANGNPRSRNISRFLKRGGSRRPRNLEVRTRRSDFQWG